MNAQQILNAALLELVKQIYGEVKYCPLVIVDTWEDGEAERWLVKISQGYKLDLRCDDVFANPVLVE